MRSQILAEDVLVDFQQKSFKLPLLKFRIYFEFTKLGRFGCPFMTGLSLVPLTWV